MRSFVVGKESINGIGSVFARLFILEGLASLASIVLFAIVLLCAKARLMNAVNFRADSQRRFQE